MAYEIITLETKHIDRFYSEVYSQGLYLMNSSSYGLKINTGIILSPTPLDADFVKGYYKRQLINFKSTVINVDTIHMEHISAHIQKHIDELIEDRKTHIQIPIRPNQKDDIPLTEYLSEAIDDSEAVV